MTPPVVTVSRVEQEHVVSVITLAFVADSVTRWALADPAEYLGHMPAVVDALGAGALDHATAYVSKMPISSPRRALQLTGQSQFRFGLSYRLGVTAPGQFGRRSWFEWVKGEHHGKRGPHRAEK